MKALVFERSVPRFALARVASALASGGAARMGPLRLADLEEPVLPGAGWHRLQPLLAGICGSDLATVQARSSRWFEPLVSFPFVPGHEVVGVLDDGRRMVLEPVLACAARGVEVPCPPCAAGDNGICERTAFGHLAPGLQTGYCADTGGGWSGALVAHDSQLHAVPADLADEAAVMVEPAACAVHAVEMAGVEPGSTVAVLGAGTLGLCTVAALARSQPGATVVAGAKHPQQRRLATDLGAGVVVEPAGVSRAVRRLTGSLALTAPVGEGGRGGAVTRLAGGADVTMDCVGSAESLAQALALTRPRGRVVLVGMPSPARVDLTPLWHREISLTGTYAYRHETFAAAFDLVQAARLERLVSALYPLERFVEALDHAAAAGRRGAVKIAFDLRRPTKPRPKRRPSGGGNMSIRQDSTATSQQEPSQSHEEKR